MNGAPETHVVELRIPARADRMAIVRITLRRAAERCGLSMAETQDLVLAVCEACQNVIQHGYAGEQNGTIVMSIARDVNGVVVRIQDSAPPVDPKKLKSRDLADVRPGGLGIHFIRNLMDSAEFLPGADGTGNVLQMTKRVNGAT